MSERTSKSSEHGLGSWATRFGNCWLAGWNQFWFTPRSPETLAVIRICCGAMMVYIHCIWLSLLTDFMGASAWIDGPTIRELHRQDWGWSWLYGVESPLLLICHQLIAIVASLCMALGLATRLSIALAWWMTLMVCHRMTGALFGLDQVVMMLSMYLMWSRCGSVWSMDARIAKRFFPTESRVFSGASRMSAVSGVGLRSEPRQLLNERSLVNRLRRWMWPDAGEAESNCVATRLIQIHLCVIYLFGGLSKMRGEMWWDGSAIWFSIVNYEYQSLNLTWLGHFPFIIGLMTATTIFWETYYCALIWPKMTRPLTLSLAFLVHGGIGAALGMWTFGTMMIVANLAFVSPHFFRQKTVRFLARKSASHG